MPASFSPDPRLVAEAMQLGRHKSEESALNAALREYIRNRKRMHVVELFGRANYTPTRKPSRRVKC